MHGIREKVKMVYQLIGNKKAGAFAPAVGLSQGSVFFAILVDKLFDFRGWCCAICLAGGAIGFQHLRF